MPPNLTISTKVADRSSVAGGGSTPTLDHMADAPPDGPSDHSAKDSRLIAKMAKGQ